MSAADYTYEEIERIAREAWNAAEDILDFRLRRNFDAFDDADEEGPVFATRRLLDGYRDEDEIEEWADPEAGRAFVDVVRDAQYQKEHPHHGRKISPSRPSQHEVPEWQLGNFDSEDQWRKYRRSLGLPDKE